MSKKPPSCEEKITTDALKEDKKPNAPEAEKSPERMLLLDHATLVSVLSHETNGKMSSIVGFAEMGLKGKCDNPDHEFCFETILKSVSAISILIQNLLLHAKIGTEGVPINMKLGMLSNEINKVWNELLPLFTTKSVHFMRNFEVGRKHHYKNEPMFNFDPDTLEWVIRNLIHNALKFSPEEGTITATVRFIKQDGEEYAEVSVADEGVGIPEDELELIFEQFKKSSRTTEKSFGVGLNICKKVIEAHNGTIKATNNKEKGSTFTFTIPLLP